MKDHKASARKVIAILDGINGMLDELRIKHEKAQHSKKAKLKKAA